MQNLVALDREASARELIEYALPAGGSRFYNTSFALSAVDSKSAKVATLIKERLDVLSKSSADRTFLNEYAQKISLLEADEFNSPVSYLDQIAQAGFEGCDVLIYADIDLNTVDGSAIWLASMAKIAACDGQVILLSKSRIKRTTVIEPLISDPNVLILTPAHFGHAGDQMALSICVEHLRSLDHALPRLRRLVLRGMAGALKVFETRQFYKRALIYLTDIYSHTDKGIEMRPGARRNVDMLARQSAGFLAQTEEIAAVLRGMTNVPVPVELLPPPVSEGLLEGAGSRLVKDVPATGPIKIGYAGKIAPQWGILDLAEWVARAQAGGLNIELVIIGDKLSGALTAAENAEFKHKIDAALARVGARRLGALDRKTTLAEMAQMDFAWCWRPAAFEEHTLELSTKMVEGVISGQRCIAFPSPINARVLGADYPFFVSNYGDFKAMLMADRVACSEGLRQVLYNRHAIPRISERLSDSLRPPKLFLNPKTVGFAGHDFKFLYPYYSQLKADGVPCYLDPWEWGAIGDEDVSRRVLAASDIIFCEWGLANAVWYADHVPDDKKLVVRMHAQEVRPTAMRFGRALGHGRVDSFVFVTEFVRDKAVELFGIDRGKTTILPNFVLDTEFLPEPKFTDCSVVRLGMVGIIPSLKRFDRALDLLELLLEQGVQASLSVKGPRPETLAYMHSGHRLKELEIYHDIYPRFEEGGLLHGHVYFEDWGNDVAQFYSGIDVILSPSDTESFHYALADGVLSGCFPVVWPWEAADRVYTPDWIVSDVVSGAARINGMLGKSSVEQQKIAASNRRLIVDRYGHRSIFKGLDTAIFDT
ncbi:hypothetical protein [Sulfitobacter donghicola]|uniref:hypothetical protein n=1 Tax=Sulfitobacter donghicola TaxID=421000 RepID=UPI0012DFB953|nr:hypothetical protein [Sulfitobacter donghicola]